MALRGGGEGHLQLDAVLDDPVVDCAEVLPEEVELLREALVIAVVEVVQIPVSRQVRGSQGARFDPLLYRGQLERLLLLLLLLRRPDLLEVRLTVDEHVAHRGLEHLPQPEVVDELPDVLLDLLVLLADDVEPPPDRKDDLEVYPSADLGAGPEHVPPLGHILVGGQAPGEVVPVSVGRLDEELSGVGWLLPSPVPDPPVDGGGLQPVDPGGGRDLLDGLRIEDSGYEPPLPESDRLVAHVGRLPSLFRATALTFPAWSVPCSRSAIRSMQPGMGSVFPLFGKGSPYCRRSLPYFTKTVDWASERLAL